MRLINEDEWPEMQCQIVGNHAFKIRSAANSVQPRGNQGCAVSPLPSQFPLRTPPRGIVGRQKGADIGAAGLRGGRAERRALPG